jgi:hypothetical protein
MIVAAPMRCCIVSAAMNRVFVAAALTILATPASAAQRPLLYDPVTLNIGVNCAWARRCMAQQEHAMSSALNYVTKHRPPHRKVQLCNRNASRGGNRVDWVGFDHCIRNPALKASLFHAAKWRHER